MRRVLIANRGEIAVRVIRACRDAGLSSLALYADQEVDALHVRLADESYALRGTQPAETYLATDKIVELAKQASADAVHPGYGFLAESAEFAEAVIDAGLTWIGPPPQAIRELGDKTVARRLAASVGAPLAPGISEPVGDASEIRDFADEHGYPILIKAAFGGGGRGMKLVRQAGELQEAFDAAVRESTLAFGRGECFVERYLERARHVETQCLADCDGNVVVLSTRDCSLQRRNQKLVEEAPAPFLTQEQERRIYEASKAILARVGYRNAGTCEFLVAPDGTISFNEVNTRLQVEHPVTELVSGIDVVREQLRIAAGGLIGYEDPAPRGHAIEFRVNGEDPGNDFLPSPGRLGRWRPPSGPGVRWDGGYEEGDVLPAEFDSLLGKLVVFGADRAAALASARRALGEFSVEGIATVLPMDRIVVDHPDFVAEPFRVHTRWIETELAPALSSLGPRRRRSRPRQRASGAATWSKSTGDVWRSGCPRGSSGEEGRPPLLPLPDDTGPGASIRLPEGVSDSVTSPMQAKVVKVVARDGQHVVAWRHGAGGGGHEDGAAPASSRRRVRPRARGQGRRRGAAWRGAVPGGPRHARRVRSVSTAPEQGDPVSTAPEQGGAAQSTADKLSELDRRRRAVYRGRGGGRS